MPYTVLTIKNIVKKRPVKTGLMWRFIIYKLIIRSISSSFSTPTYRNGL